MTTLVLTDNPFALSFARELNERHGGIDIFQSPKGFLAGVPTLNVKAQHAEIASRYDLVISVHCKQLFPPELVRTARCVNVHPGLNPQNRGWYPQVFSIINGKKAGVTIHEIDEQLDHGPIIVQREYKIKSWDTSETAYNNIMLIERELLLEHYPSIRENTYSAHPPAGEGNLNYKADFEALTRLDLDETLTMRAAIDRLRALTHGHYKNAHFYDVDGVKIYVNVVLTPADSHGPKEDAG